MSGRWEVQEKTWRPGGEGDHRAAQKQGFLRPRGCASPHPGRPVARRGAAL